MRRMESEGGRGALRIRLEEFHRLFELSLEAHESTSVASPIGVEILDLTAIRRQDLFLRAGEGQIERKDAPRRIPADPFGQFEAIFGHEDERSPQRPQVGADIERHADIAQEGQPEHQKQIGERYGQIDAIGPGLFRSCGEKWLRKHERIVNGADDRANGSDLVTRGLQMGTLGVEWRDPRRGTRAHAAPPRLISIPSPK